MVFDILVQWGTLVGVIIYFWRDIVQIVRAVFSGLAHRKPFETFDARLGWLVVVATIPAVIAGVFIKQYLAQLYEMYILISIVLMLGGVLMLAAERFGKRTRDLKQMAWLDSIIVGLWQILAMIPGVSRSSATISGGMLRDFKREDAARFSFLMSIPALLGAGVVAHQRFVGSAGPAGLAGCAAAGWISGRGDHRLFQHPLAARLSQDPIAHHLHHLPLRLRRPVPHRRPVSGWPIHSP